VKQPSVLPNVWPKLPNTEWTDALATLHLWTQIVGKVRLELSPWLNHSWQATLYVTSRGLTTSAIPYGGKTLQIEDPIPFPEDLVHSSYEPEQVHLFWRALGQSARVFEAFRARFIGKCSPVVSSGAASIWRSHGSRGDLRQSTPAVSPISQMWSQ